MDSFFELERYTAPTPGLVLSEERFRDYVIKWTRYDEHESLWVFREGRLKGSIQWQPMVLLDAPNQIIMRYPSAFDGLMYAQWEPEPDATDRDLSVALSRLSKIYLQAFPEDKHTGVLVYGEARVDLGENLNACVLSVGGVDLALFQATQEDRRLIDLPSIRHCDYYSPFDTLLTDDVQDSMLELGQYVLDYFTVQIPDYGTVIH
jgi:hypothetical protein